MKLVYLLHVLPLDLPCVILQGYAALHDLLRRVAQHGVRGDGLHQLRVQVHCAGRREI